MTRLSPVDPEFPDDKIPSEHKDRGNDLSHHFRQVRLLYEQVHQQQIEQQTDDADRVNLRKFLQKIKELEYPIKLDTNGYMPGVLWELLQEHLIDYVAMDIKASRDNYARAAGLPHMDISRIEESIGILKSSGIPYEFRTTVVKGIHTVGEFKEIGRWIEGCPAYYLQSYQENDNCLYRMTQTAESNAVKPGGAELFGAFSREKLEQMAELVRKYVGKVVLRGVVGT